MGKEGAELAKSAAAASSFLKDVYHKNYDKVKPALDKYLAKESQLHKEFCDMLKRIAFETFECDEKCINDCIKHEFITFWEIPKCVMHCDCKKDIIKIKGGNLNLPKLMLYSDYDQNAWQFFKMHSDHDM